MWNQQGVNIQGFWLQSYKVLMPAAGRFSVPGTCFFLPVISLQGSQKCEGLCWDHTFFLESGFLFFYFFLYKFILKTLPGCFLQKDQKAPSQVILPSWRSAVWKGCQTKRLQSGVTSPQIPPLNQKNTTTRKQTIWCINWKHYSLPGSGLALPPGGRAKRSIVCFVCYLPGGARERGPLVIQPWCLLLCVQTAETDGNANACVRWRVREAWPDLRYLAVNLVCLEPLAELIQFQLESRRNNCVKLASLFSCSSLFFLFLPFL